MPRLDVLPWCHYKFSNLFYFLLNPIHLVAVSGSYTFEIYEVKSK